MFLLSIGAFLFSAHLFWQSEPIEKPIIQATYIDKTIKIDGVLAESEWNSIPSVEGFTQRTPDTGAPSRFRTRVRLAYDDTYLYVAAEMFDAKADSIANTVFRKDGGGYSDWFRVQFDSYADKRTAFSFEVNPAGVRRDFIVFNDRDTDFSWEAVWRAASQVNDSSWTSELHIPLSQIRYDATLKNPTWGINFRRVIARYDEVSYWAPTPPEAPGQVSLFGRAQGLNNLTRPRRLEIIPYISEQAIIDDVGSSENPFFQKFDNRLNAGADIRYGVGSNFTLTTTINPDFGQAEVDPAVVNLSAFEVFFPERRSFFLEGSDIFSFGSTRTRNVSSRPRIFNSRRIGRTPSGSAPDSAAFSDRPLNTTIAMANKFSGKSTTGLSIGVLNAFTLEEDVRFSTRNDFRGRRQAEPYTNYFVGRLRQDFNEGLTNVGGFFSAVNRINMDEHTKQEMHENAYVLGGDFEHQFASREWTASGSFSASLVQGTEEMLLKTQTANRRSFQRPDAGHLSVDSTKTDLTGYYAEASVFHRSEKWVNSITLNRLTPGFETNDLGFQTATDRQSINLFNEYQQNSPQGPFQDYSIFSLVDWVWTTDGSMVEHDYFGGANFRFRNFWRIRFRSSFSPEHQNDRLTRGGPIAKRPSNYRIELSFSSDSRKVLSVNSGHSRRYDSSGKEDFRYWLGFDLRPTAAIQVNIRGEFSREFDTDQFITKFNDPTATETFGVRYIFGDMRTHRFGGNFRMTWAFQPDLTLQIFAQPLLFTGDFQKIKYFNRPDSFSFTSFSEQDATLQTNEDGSEFILDPDGSGQAPSKSISNPDFNFVSLRGNAVLRWEFKPGSTLFLVWQHFRDDNTDSGRFDIGRDYHRLSRLDAVNSLLLKLAYWFG